MTRKPGDRCGLERIVEQVVFGPIDVTIRAFEELPDTIDRARQQLAVARFVGKLAVDQGVGEVGRRLDAAARLDADRSAEPSSEERSGGPTVDDLEDVATAPADVVAGDPEPGGVETADLALPDYEQLPAAHIVAKLAGLQQPERDEIELFESSHRHRRTILGKLDQLRESS